MISGSIVRTVLIVLFLIASGVARAAPPANSLTILINGFGSTVPFIGYGFENLKDKIPGAQLYSYVGAVEGWTYIAPKVLKDVRNAYRYNPGIEINLVGVSFGANLLTRIVARLNKDGIPVNYLGLIDGLPLTPVTPNVRRVDNFTCSLIGCLGDRVKLTRDNHLTIVHSFNYKVAHIELPNTAEIQQRILHQITTTPVDVFANPGCESETQASLDCSIQTD